MTAKPTKARHPHVQRPVMKVDKGVMHLERAKQGPERLKCGRK